MSSTKLPSNLEFAARNLGLDLLSVQIAWSTLHAKQHVHDNTPKLSYRFDIKDSQAWKSHLEQKGFVVVSRALKQEEVLQTRSLLWDDLETTVPKLSRSDVNTWDTPWRGDGGPGIKAELAQTAAAWHVRGAPGVKEIFAHIWDTDDLIVSMDGVIVWKP